MTVPFHGGPGETLSGFAGLYLALVPALPDRDLVIADPPG